MQQNRASTFYARYGKRAFDLVASFVLLIISFPLFILTSIAIRLTMGKPVLFVQDRGGYLERVFKIYKFRTMVEAKPEHSLSHHDHLRLTNLGKHLRNSSIDELPNLINILKGDMSLVGPRPQLVAYTALLNKNQKRRHLVKPGLTGWAQINGRNSITWEERFNLDVWYVDNMSFWLDIKILWMTGHYVLRREGISASNHPTMPPLEPMPETEKSF